MKNLITTPICILNHQKAQSKEKKKAGNNDYNYRHKNKQQAGKRRICARNSDKIRLHHKNQNRPA